MKFRIEEDGASTARLSQEETGKLLSLMESKSKEVIERFDLLVAIIESLL